MVGHIDGPEQPSGIRINDVEWNDVRALRIKTCSRCRAGLARKGLTIRAVPADIHCMIARGREPSHEPLGHASKADTFYATPVPGGSTTKASPCNVHSDGSPMATQYFG